MLEDTSLEQLKTDIENLEDFLPGHALAFAQAYIGGERVTKAARAVDLSPAVARNYLRGNVMQRYIKLLQTKRQLETGVDSAWKRAKLIGIIQETADDRIRLSAIAELNKMDGDYKPQAHTLEISLIDQIQQARARAGVLLEHDAG